ncbi:MAG TPA: hypothetical protein VFS23_27970 [Vicinamibacterales bacterium]|nr:hypothetical protein [Vicinamibacterales bacterium]
MTHDGQRPDPLRFQIENEMDLLLGRAHPNPTREGCPPRELLVSLSRRELPIGDPAYDHLSKCSPCYQEVRALQQADAAARTAATRYRRLMYMAAAAVLVLTIAGSWLALRQGGEPAISTPTATDTAPQVASLDLRPLAVTRSEDAKSAKPLQVPRGRVNATILLPVGAAPGVYEVRILDGDLRVRASATGSAEIRNYVTTLEAAIDTSGLDVGDYQLTLRREGGEWQMFPLHLR